MRFWTRRRTLYMLTAIAMASATGGFGLASTLSSTSISQTASLFSVSTSGVAAFPTPPTVQVAAVPLNVSACSASPTSLTSGGSVLLFLPASSLVSCNTGDFAVALNFTSAATAAAGTYTFSSFDAYGSGPTNGASVGTVDIASVLSSSGTVSVYIDFGGPSPPPGGISSLSLVVG